MNPEEVKKLPAARSLLHADGLTEEQINKPLVAVVNSFNEITPGHIHLNKLGEKVKQGIRDAGAVPLEFHTIAVCDGIAMGHQGMKLSLPSRETIADSIEQMVAGHGVFAGAVFIASCDKCLPGHLKAAARVNLPSIFLTGGPMMPGKWKEKTVDVKNSFEARALYDTGKMPEEDYTEMICNSCPGAGSCAGLFTANSMACITEAMGLSLPQCASTHATDPAKLEIAYNTGKQIVSLIKQNLTAKQIMTEDTFQNALRVDMAIGASTNTILHIPDIAKEAGIEINLEEINLLSNSTPNLVHISPNSDMRMIDFHNAGGVGAVLKELNTKNLIKNTKTIDGDLKQRIAQAQNKNESVIRPSSNPYSKNGGIAILYGNLAEEGSVIKTAGLSAETPKVFEGEAKVFNSEEEATQFIESPNLAKGQVIIIRYEGKLGGPGMREMLYPTSAISGMKMDNEVALITDGRFSGATKGICIGHVEPEAARAGNIALIKDGDKIRIDLNEKRIDLLLDSSELEKRKSNIIAPEQKDITGALLNYKKSLQR